MTYIIFFAAFITSFSIVPIVTAFANNSGAIAVPGRRHTHSYPTPKLGGIAIAAGVLIISPIIFPVDRVIGSYLLASSVMLLLGIIDDIRGTNWKVKLAFTVVATLIMKFGGGVWITTVGDLFGVGDITLGIWGLPFTIFAVFGVVNAINLIDGLNGLACGVSSIAFLSFAIFASISGNETVLVLSIASLGATLGLFRYNYPRARIFMGDSGSLFLGFSLAMLAILLTQGEGKINPMIPVIVLGIPIFDTVRVLCIRIINSRHPFKGDRTHLHHLMKRSGIPLHRVVKTIWILSVLMSSIAFTLYDYDGWLMLLIYCISLALIGVFIENLKILRESTTRR
jgi:UDP-GlcNAc:undecaprenyl-phosphate GlcNAc-1-phosphate transferase